MQNNDVIFYNGAEEFAKNIKGPGSFVLVMANTGTATIPGITAAGASVELNVYTPPLDAEFVNTGRLITLTEIPFTPPFIPTPGIITRAVITLSDFREFYVDAGMNVPPVVPHYTVGFGPGNDIRTGKAVCNVREIIENAKKVGAEIASKSEYLVIGETLPAGTTTALGVLLAMGLDTNGYTSSSMNVNPHQLKSSVVFEGLRNAGINGPCDPIKAIESLGDPMMAATIGLMLGAKGVPVILAGGTQMASVMVLFSKLYDIKEYKVALSTTRWVAEDTSSKLFGILEQTGIKVPVLVANISFAKSKFEGLLAYEKGYVKEGVGAGGISAVAMLKGIPKEKIESTVEEIYGFLVSH
jgi:uncharacterized protein (TIGR00303 family)